MKRVVIVAVLAAAGCSVQKTESSAGMDTAATTVAIPAPAPAEDSGKRAAPRAAAKPAIKTPPAGGERDSAVQAQFEIGPDGKLRRVKR